MIDYHFIDSFAAKSMKKLFFQRHSPPEIGAATVENIVENQLNNNISLHDFFSINCIYFILFFPSSKTMDNFGLYFTRIHLNGWIFSSSKELQYNLDVGFRCKFLRFPSKSSFTLINTIVR